MITDKSWYKQNFEWFTKKVYRILLQSRTAQTWVHKPLSTFAYVEGFSSNKIFIIHPNYYQHINPDSLIFSSLQGYFNLCMLCYLSIANINHLIDILEGNGERFRKRKKLFMIRKIIIVFTSCSTNIWLI